MQRYFVPKENMTDTKVTITGEDVKHIARVMRMKIGDMIICSNSIQAARCKLEEITDNEVTANIVEWIEEQKELPVAVTIAQGLPKGDKLDYIIQKGTELGANSFWPFAAARSVVKWNAQKGQKKIERLEKIAKEAAEQSHRTQVPTVQLPTSFQDLLKESSHYDIKLIAYEESAKTGEKKNLAKTLNTVQSGQTILLVIGPEGGLSEHEVMALEEQGFVSCGLGPRILRTETAALYFLAAVSYHTELM
ncbi:16S rRNA (uracil(1498)-N(3))-methyltransferase [Bacillus taeanensis]|uniref:Ribosomal RNA small subunit methyltransferase E n=1 Tax=Bacillus taeanensis TaxID=273032 RepID=A0A366XYE7_9BACI|nr:16S rRNA (uracil(1498)-N(3))-methyltransferase [Bacillus taeanensis]RBW70646.1 16S rRNA (uracil(1498)-N(3))-methyltransferase [Bacillus taeanensis]